MLKAWPPVCGTTRWRWNPKMSVSFCERNQVVGNLFWVGTVRPWTLTIRRCFPAWRQIAFVPSSASATIFHFATGPETVESTDHGVKSVKPLPRVILFLFLGCLSQMSQHSMESQAAWALWTHSTHTGSSYNVSNRHLPQDDFKLSFVSSALQLTLLFPPTHLHALVLSKPGLFGHQSS